MKDQLLEEINNNIEDKIEQSAIESCQDIKATKLRQLLKVPKEQRIAQHIYNCCREYEVNGYEDKFEAIEINGIDIFGIEDDEFIKLMKNETNL